MMKGSKLISKVMSLIVVALLCVELLPAAVFADDNVPIDAEQGEESMVLQEAPEHEHIYVEHAEKPATCEHSGMKAYFDCSVEGCDKLFDHETKAEITDPMDLIIPMKDHVWEKTGTDPNNLMISIYKCKNCGATKEEEDPNNFIPGIVPPSVKAKTTFKLVGANGKTLPNKLYFKSKVTKNVMPFMDQNKIGRIWLKAGKTSMKINWTVTDTMKKMKFVDEVIILRKSGSVYKEVGRVAMKKNNKGVLTWSPKTSFTDKTAKKKNKAYNYIVVTAYSEDDIDYISSYSDWAAGQTTKSKKKSVYKAKINKKSVSLQYKGKSQLKLKYSKPKKTYNAKSFRWYSDNAKVAKVSSKGKVTATGVGTTTIRGRLSSGHDMTCKVTVVGAFKPTTPKLSVDVATNSSISLYWSKAKNATSYDLYRSDDGLHWKAPVRVKGTSKKVTGLKKGHRYSFYVIARNDNHGYTSKSSNSNVVVQKAVIKRRPTSVSGFPKSKTLTSGTSFTVTLKISSPDGRNANLQMKSGKKWTTKKTVKLPSGAGQSTVKILFPNSWWKGKTTWRLVIPVNTTSEAYTSPVLTITAKRRYQNPSNMVQIKNSISKHGFSHYVAPVLIDDMSTRTDCVEALIKTANKYKGTQYVSGKTAAPGKGIDAGGLVIESCYGAGVDLWPISPSTRNVNAAPAIMDSALQSISYGTPVEGNFPNVYRGDLIFFKTSKNHVGHVAIYTGLGQVIHASMVTGKVETDKLLTLIDKKGKYKYTIAGVRRVFHF